MIFYWYRGPFARSECGYCRLGADVKRKMSGQPNDNSFNS